MKTTILLIASWVVLAAYGQNIIRSFADSGCTDLVGFAVSDDVCAQQDCSQWGTTGQYFTVTCGGSAPEVPADMWPIFGGTSSTCSNSTSIYAGKPNVCWIYGIGGDESLLSMNMNECLQDGGLSVALYGGNGLCASNQLFGRIVVGAECSSSDSYLPESYIVSGCAGQNIPIAEPQATSPESATPSDSPNPTGTTPTSGATPTKPSAPTSSTTPAKKSTAASGLVVGSLVILPALFF